MTIDAGKAPQRADMQGVLEARIDLNRFDHNVAAFHRRAETQGVAVRAHVKGHRCVELAQRQVASGATGIAVHFAAEARRYIEAGLTDVLIAQPWHEPWRWRLLAQLAADCRLTVHVDEPTMLRGLAEAARIANTEIHVLLRLDDGKAPRSIPYGDVCDAVDAVRRERGLHFDGIYAYQGISTADGIEQRTTLGVQVAKHVVRMAERLRTDRRPCRVVAVGGTPTAAGVLDVAGVTEVCAGAYALLDAGMAAARVCTKDDIAISVRVSADANPMEQEDARRLLTIDPYPWQDTASFTAPPGDWVAPLHICPLAMRWNTVVASGSGPDVCVWRPGMPRDEMPPTVTPEQGAS